MAMQQYKPIIQVLAASIGINAPDNVTITFWKSVSTDRQCVLDLHPGSSDVLQSSKPILILLAALMSNYATDDIAIAFSNKHQLRVNSFCRVTVCYTAQNCTALFLNVVITGQSSQFVFVFHFTIIHAMFHRSDFVLAWNSGVNG